MDTALRPILEEAIARRRGEVMQDRIYAFFNLLGFWTGERLKPVQWWRRENEWVSGPLRGMGTTNFHDSATKSRNYPQVSARYPALERDVRYLAHSHDAQLLDYLYRLYQVLRPLLALLVLWGLAAALRRGAWPVVAVALFALGNIAVLALVVMTNVDRYALPFWPLESVVAVYGLSALVRARAEPGKAASGSACAS